MTTRHRWVILILTALIACWTMDGRASGPRFWQVSTQADMLKGEVEGLSVDDSGRLVLGPVVKPIFESTVPFIWCLSAGADGAVFAGSGNDGQVWRIDAKGKAAEFFKATELEVHAMIPAPDGGLFVATSPDGKIYRLDPSGKAAVYFDPDDKYIWALAVDRQGRLFAGTGDKGVIYRISTAGRGEVFYKTNTKNVTSLAFDRDGQLLATTDSPGRVLRIDEAGKAFALLDSPFREMRALHVAPDGTIYAAAVNGKPGGGGDERMAAPPTGEQPKPPTAGVSTEIMSMAIGDVSASLSSQPSTSSRGLEKSGSKGAVYRVDKDGGTEIVWESKDDVPFDLSADERGITVATGNRGKLFRVEGNPAHTTLVTRLGGQQITSVLSNGQARYFATSNPAKVYAIAGERNAEGTYVSDVKDAGMVATWGTLSWRAVEPGGSRVRLVTRTGNTSVPDDTWSPWSAVYTQPDGDAVRNPSARFLQWRAALSSAPADKTGPALLSVRVGYQQHNARPDVVSISVLPPGTVFQRPFPTGEPEIAGLAETPVDARMPVFSLPLGTPQPGPSLGRRMYQKGLQAFTWKADDDNDDRMTFDVYYRQVESIEWKLLRRGLTDSMLTWDTTSVPDGTYLIKVAASDAPSNRATEALVGELESDAFDIDNTPPVITVISVTRDGAGSTVLVEVRDAHSPVGIVEYSVDAARWQPIFPVEGVADRTVGRYAVKVDSASVDRLVIRAADTLTNMATLAVGARKEIPSKK